MAGVPAHSEQASVESVMADPISPLTLDHVSVETCVQQEDDQSDDPPPASSSSVNAAPITRSQTSTQNGLRVSPQNVTEMVTYLKEYQGDGRINVGSDYQVHIPEYNPTKWDAEYDEDEVEERRESSLLWAPPPLEKGLSDEEIWQFCVTAKRERDFAEEQALGLLALHYEYDLEKASENISQYCQLMTEWTDGDKELFEQAFSMNGKTFRRIKQMMPEKSIGDVVAYYYKWKRNRPPHNRNQYEESGQVEEQIMDRWPKLDSCFKCDAPCVRPQVVQQGSLCGTCYLKWRRAGEFQSVSRDTNHSQLAHSNTDPGAVTPEKADGADEREGNDQQDFDTSEYWTPPMEMTPPVLDSSSSTVILNGSSNCDFSSSLDRTAMLRKLEQAIARIRMKADQNGAQISPIENNIGYA